MKPYLVDYKTIIKLPPPPKIEIKPKIIKSPPVNINYTHLIFNMIGLLFIIIGLYALYSRNKEKEKNKVKHKKDIELLTKKINLIS